MIFRPIVIVLFFASIAFGSFPLPDLVFYGRIYNLEEEKMVGMFPGGVTLAAKVEGFDTVVAVSTELHGPDGIEPEYYVLRIPRRDLAALSDRGEEEEFAVASETIHLYIDWDLDGSYEPDEEVKETLSASIMVTDALTDFRYLSLNKPEVRDSDLDNLPDEWEQRFFNHLDRSGSEIGPNGVSLLFLYALGLNPNEDNGSRMPFLGVDSDVGLVLYFTQPSGGIEDIEYSVLGNDDLVGEWSSVSAIVETIEDNGSVRIVRAILSEEGSVSNGFFRLEVGVSE